MTRSASAEAAHCGGFAVVAGRSTGVARGSDACRSDHLRSPRRRLLGPRSCERLPRRPGRLLFERRLAPDAGGPLVQQQLPPERRRGRGRPSRRARRRGRRADRRSVHVVLRRVPVRRFDVAYGLGVSGRSVVATGSTVVAAERAPSVAVARLRWSGGLAPGFGRRRTLPSPGGGIGRAVLIDPSGRILVGGRAYSDSSQDASDWTLLRYGRGGRLDRSLGATASWSPTSGPA